ncbi:hypothetical protein FOQG_10425 [Fusarium oxysporum f. sp. raphani 54005]|uniref:Uncharacterized protein n=3 Tax=Fusarium oxysporum TaxID=5507 RepID=X0C391_FUSOX|nr:hypothetical protein FOMG_19114 [Fusarium oxysporum f. sp. melonis 26406]EXK85633.1 hypothetical protein FOQG_10425 [Fusarium oxysporum f. sp. raphani 54005]EXM19458.1 hypothetical protein FOTG_12509 [Fusarium oxysporum f. sp. vasinfectum 25433]
MMMGRIRRLGDRIRRSRSVGRELRLMRLSITSLVILLASRLLFCTSMVSSWLRSVCLAMVPRTVVQRWMGRMLLTNQLLCL